MADRSGGALGRLFLGVLDRTHVRSRAARVTVMAGVASLLGAGWLIVYATNGASTPFTHVMHVPIILASMTFGVAWGVVTAIAAGTLLGPLMPLDVELARAQPLATPLYRGMFFVLIAIVTGTFADAARMAAGHLKRAQAAWEAQSFENVRLIARLVAGRDEQTGRHCERVGLNAVALGRAAGLSGPELRHCYLAGVLHDIGKLKVPDDILRKPTTLTEEEAGVMMRHPALGEEIVLSIYSSATEVARGTRSHHERWDGSGYPDGLAGEEIPLIGRILAIVDVFEAVTGTRPYRGPMAVAEARRVVAEGAGTHFDPRLVETFLGLEASGAIDREEGPTLLYVSLPDDGFVVDDPLEVDEVARPAATVGD